MPDILERRNPARKSDEEFRNEVYHNTDELRRIKHELETLHKDLNKIESQLSNSDKDRKDSEKEMDESRKLLLSLDKLLALHAQESEYRKKEVTDIKLDLSKLKEEQKVIDKAAQKTSMLVSVLVSAGAFLVPFVVKIFTGGS